MTTGHKTSLSFFFPSLPPRDSRLGRSSNPVKIIVNMSRSTIPFFWRKKQRSRIEKKKKRKEKKPPGNDITRHVPLPRYISKYKYISPYYPRFSRSLSYSPPLWGITNTGLTTQTKKRRRRRRRGKEGVLDLQIGRTNDRQMTELRGSHNRECGPTGPARPI